MKFRKICIALTMVLAILGSIVTSFTSKAASKPEGVVCDVKYESFCDQNYWITDQSFCSTTATGAQCTVTMDPIDGPILPAYQKHETLHCYYPLKRNP